MNLKKKKKQAKYGAERFHATICCMKFFYLNFNLCDFFNYFLLHFTFLCDVDAILSLECVYEEKYLTLIGTITCELCDQKASLGLCLL